MIAICCGLWDANPLSKEFSRHYTEADVEKLYRGFARNLTMPFRFICWSEKDRFYREPIEQRRFSTDRPSYCTLTELYQLNEPMILVGLDTVITGNCDDIAQYCLEADKPAAPIDPFMPHTVCNGVVLVPGGHDWMFTQWGGGNDMDWIRDLYKAKRLVTTDAHFPGQIVSYKGNVMRTGLGDARICYFHGEKKPHELGHVGWLERHWV